MALLNPGFGFWYDSPRVDDFRRSHSVSIARKGACCSTQSFPAWQGPSPRPRQAVRYCPYRVFRIIQYRYLQYLSIVIPSSVQRSGRHCGALTQYSRQTRTLCLENVFLGVLMDVSVVLLSPHLPIGLEAYCGWLNDSAACVALGMAAEGGSTVVAE
ncbi:hypothetical protein VTG60DRAFT_6816 [Thermothelomyces hinnuleus]